MDLSQTEADTLLAMKKIQADNKVYSYPFEGGSLTIPLKSEDGREEFQLDINRRRAKLEKVTYQNRGQTTIILARLDFGAKHRNPDGEEIGSPHIHLYREGYADKWAFELPSEHFDISASLSQIFEQFLSFCNIVKLTNFQNELL